MVREEKDRVEKRQNRRMKGRMKAWRGRGGPDIKVRRERGDSDGQGRERKTADGRGKRRSKAVRMTGRSKQTGERAIQ